MALKMLFGMKILSENLEMLKSLRRAWIRQVTPCNRHGQRSSFCVSTAHLGGRDPQVRCQVEPLNLLTVDFDCHVSSFIMRTFTDPLWAPAYWINHETNIVTA